MQHPTVDKDVRAPGVMILGRRDMARLMTPADYRDAVRRAFMALAEGRGTCPPPMHIETTGGGFHVKGAGFAAGDLAEGSRALVAFKINGNFPGNPERNGLPTIQGALLLCDGQTGSPLALMDSAEITVQRTAAATAVAAEYLARPGSTVVTLCGCGGQALAQLRALVDVLPLQSGFAWDLDRDRAERLAQQAAELGVALAVPRDLREATLASDVIVTCTTSREPFLDAEHVAAGAFVAAVGTDWPAKSEIAPRLMAKAKVVVDALDQCLAMGDLHHAVRAGAVTASDVHGELGELVIGRKAGRVAMDEITLFDSTGVAVQDIASAAVIYERACATKPSVRIDLAASA